MEAQDDLFNEMVMMMDPRNFHWNRPTVRPSAAAAGQGRGRMSVDEVKSQFSSLSQVVKAKGVDTKKPATKKNKARKLDRQVN